MPYPKYNKEKLEGYVQNVRKILGILHAPRLSVVENHGVDECITTPESETGMTPFPFTRTMC